MVGTFEQKREGMKDKVMLATTVVVMMIHKKVAKMADMMVEMKAHKNEVIMVEM